MSQTPPFPFDTRETRSALRASRDGQWNDAPPATLAETAAGMAVCRRCDLWRGATRAVPGEEDLAGRPFVGPAGRVLDAGLKRAGIDRSQTFVTNAVKHFKHEQRGKRRLHKPPDVSEITACRWWLDAERRLVAPKVIVAMGASAALGVFGKATAINANRGRALPLSGGIEGVVTFHPSYLLRLPDEAAKRGVFAHFVADLKFAWSRVS
jgi:uracil-DNA glycosylase family protein